MTDEQIALLAERVLRPRLGPLGMERIAASSGYDHDGDPVVFVEAHYRIGSPVPEGSTMLAAVGALHQALLAEGEERLPFLDHRFGGEQADDAEDVGLSAGPAA